MNPAIRNGLLLASLAAAACAAGPTDKRRDAVASAIDCDRLGAPVSVEAGSKPQERPVQIGQLLKVRLQPLRAVSPGFPPGRKEKGEERFAGHVALRATEAGTYTVLLASLAWVDLGEADPPRLVPPQSFEWINVCGTKFKSGLYTLKPGTPYFVQLWDSPDREVAMMIRRL